MSARDWLLEDRTMNEITEAADSAPQRGTHVVLCRADVLDRPHFEFVCLFAAPRIEPEIVLGSRDDVGSGASIEEITDRPD